MLKLGRVAVKDTLTTVKQAAADIRAATADAIWRYHRISGLPHAELPESFIVSFVFSRLGDKYAMTLETGARDLTEHDAMLRHQPEAADPGRTEELSRAIRTLDGEDRAKGRIDLVLYGGGPSDRFERPFLALAEFKKWNRWREDREKLAIILRLLPSCPHGLVCFLAEEAPENRWLQRHAREAEERGDIWGELAMDGVMHNGYPLKIVTIVVSQKSKNNFLAQDPIDQLPAAGR